MRAPHLIKALGLTLGLAAGLASSPAHAGDYLNTTATQPQYLTINGVQYICFTGMAPTNAEYDWCLNSVDPAAAAMATVVASAFVRNHTIGVGCTTCNSFTGDAKWPGTYWIPEYVFDSGKARAVSN